MDIKSHLLSRHFLNADSIPTTTETATFYLYNFNHELVGYQQYRPSGNKVIRKNPKLGRYFTYLTKPGVWGLDYVPFSDYLVICEGVFKACRFHNYDIPAIATLSNNPVHLEKQLALLSLTTKLIVIPDPDPAGMKLLKYGTHHIIPHKPVDQLTCEELLQLIDRIQEIP